MSTASHFDYDAALAESDQETIEIIAQVFIDQWPLDWHKMQEALVNGNLTPMIYVAHALKGTLAMFGALPGVALAQRIEALASANDATGLAALLQALAVEVHQLVAAVRRARPATS